MGSAAEIKEPTTGVDKHPPVKVEDEEEEEQVFELERKTSSFRHGKGLYSADNSTITTSSSSSFSGDVTDVIPDFRNGEGDYIGIENLDVPEPAEQETGIGFQEEHDDDNNCNVYFDGEQGIWKCRHCDWTYQEGSDLADAELDANESQTADHLNGEKKQSKSENLSTSEDNKVAHEIEEVKDGDFPKEIDVVDQPTGDEIEEELEVEDYDVEKVLDNQETHDLFCPNCNSCITKRVILKKRKRSVPHVLEDPKRLRGPQIEPLLHSEDNLPSAEGGENPAPESFVFKCLSCFNIFIPKGVSSKPLPPKESLEGLKTQKKPQEEATGNSNWFSSIFGLNKRVPAVQQGGASPSVPQANLGLSGEDTTSSSGISPSKSPALVQGDAATLVKAPVLVQRDATTSIEDESEISASEDKQPVDTPMIQDANSHGTSTINNAATTDDKQKFQAPLAEVQTQETLNKIDSSPVDENHTSDNGHLSPIEPFHNMNISNKVTRGPDGGVTVETVFHTDDASHLFDGTHTSDTRKRDFGQSIVTGVTDTSESGMVIGSPSPGIDILPVSSLEEGTLSEPLLRPVVEGRKIEILKSIVYGGLIESITSLGVISSAAGSGASTLSILVLGLANLFGGLILIFHNLQELREEEPIRATTEDNQTNGQEVGRYKQLLGRRENFTLHATVAILSFIIVGLLPPIVYYFSFSKTHNKDYKVASILVSSLLCIVLLAIAKAHVKTPRGSYLKSVMYYALIAVSVSGISYIVGEFVDRFLEKYGLSDGSETPARHVMLSLMGRKAGNFGYSAT